MVKVNLDTIPRPPPSPHPFVKVRILRIISLLSESLNVSTRSKSFDWEGSQVYFYRKKQLRFTCWNPIKKFTFIKKIFFIKV